MFETDPDSTELVENGIVLRMGVAKGVRIVKNDGNPMPAIILDCESLLGLSDNCTDHPSFC
jgi:hypothetical protein